MIVMIKGQEGDVGRNREDVERRKGCDITHHIPYMLRTVDNTQL
jgi:hypothetical protein